MRKPTTLKELLAGGHITMGDVRKLAKIIFDGKTTAAGPEGYVVTAVAFDSLGGHVQQFILKAILDFKAENVLDHMSRWATEDEIVEATTPIGEERDPNPGF
jgi:hypothetical protein